MGFLDMKSATLMRSVGSFPDICLNSALYLCMAVMRVCSLGLAENNPLAIFFEASTTAILSVRQIIGKFDSLIYTEYSCRDTA